MSGRTCSYPRVSTACIYMMFKVLNRKCGLICSCRVYIACYLPKETDLGQKRPLFAFIHGGGWSSSKIFADQPCWQWDHLGYPARYFADKGFSAWASGAAFEFGDFKASYLKLLIKEYLVIRFFVAPRLFDAARDSAALFHSHGQIKKLGSVVAAGGNHMIASHLFSAGECFMA